MRILRCLISGIKTLGAFPCPVCLVGKAHIWLMGTKNDMTQRFKKLRQDTAAIRWDLARARQFIYEKGIPAEGAALDRLLAKLQRRQRALFVPFCRQRRDTLQR